MQTQCPQCDTRFRVTETQLNIADGVVRCGICEHVFNVYGAGNPALQKQTAPEMVDQIQTDQIQTNQDQTGQEQTTRDSKVQSSLPHTDSAERYDDTAHDDESIDELTDEYRPDKSKTQLNQHVTENTETSTATSEIENNSERDTDNFDVVLDAEELDSKEQQKDTYNFFENDHDDSTGFVVPREFHDSHLSDTPSAISTALWGIGILLLTASLFIEYVWFNRNDFIHVPEIQTEIDTLCQQFDCTKLSLRAPSKIELVSRNIYTHPNEKEALMVNVTIKNNAAFSQPYPMMKIEFTDIRGNIVASRNFSPQEYLYAQYQQHDEQQRLAPDSSSDITIEVQDPGTQALTYEFSFL